MVSSVRRVLITVRTYPVPANKGAETSCTAAISDSGEWIRLFPVPYRSLPPSKRFKKYQWIEAELKKARGDPRPESHNISIDTIRLGEVVSPEKGWAKRKAILAPLMRRSHCEIRKERDDNEFPTLGLFRPKTIKRLIIEPTATPDWTTGQKAILSQTAMGFDARAPKVELEKIPFNFYYEFVCDSQDCRGHKLSCTDWEMAELYRKCRSNYGDLWETKFRDRYERDMIERRDTHFYVGTMHGHQGAWIIVGLFYPPKPKVKGPVTRDLFETDAG
jgi:hypothetical protein